MNIKLKKFKILEPKVKINSGLKTIARESKIITDIKPVNAMVATFSAGQSVLGDLSVIEEGNS